MSKHRLTEWKNRIPQAPEQGRVPNTAVMVQQQLAQMATQMGLIEEKLGAHGADINNLRAGIERLETAMHNQSARIDMRQTEIISTIENLRTEVRDAIADAHKRSSALETRIDDLEHAKTYSSGVIRTVKILAGAVVTMFATIIGFVVKFFAGN